MSDASSQHAYEYKRASRSADRAFARRVLFLLLAGVVALGTTLAWTRCLTVPTIDLAAHPVAAVPPLASRSFLIVVRSGDTLSRLFDRHDLSGTDLRDVLAVGGPTARLKTLMPGDKLAVRATLGGSVVSLAVEVDETRRLEIERIPRGFAARIVELPIERRLVVARGTIESSLFASAATAGLSGKLTMSFAGIFGYDIDFLQDLRRGDRFAVLHEELWRDGTKLRDGAILAAEFENDGRLLQAVRFAPAGVQPEYYSPAGGSMRKALTRNPVDFARVSSGFSTARRHPILNRVRAHQGVDYAAPSGTPVRAAGDGKIVFRGVRGGYGNAIVIQHGVTYSTLYGHLSQFARGLSVGTRVTQDQLIGFVGTSGLATAPHLHYEVLVNGVHRNPRTVVLPDAAPVPAATRPEFESVATRLLRQLRTPARPATAT